MAMEYVDPDRELDDFDLDNRVRNFTRHVVGAGSTTPTGDAHIEVEVPMDKKALSISLENHRILGRLSLIEDATKYIGDDMHHGTEDTVSLFATIDWDDDPHLYRASTGLRVETRITYNKDDRPDEIITELVDLQSSRDQIRPTLRFMAIKQFVGDHGKPTVLRPPTECSDSFGTPTEPMLELLESMYTLAKYK